MGSIKQNSDTRAVRTTLRDVATLAGVSEISVSRVMRNAPNVSNALREKVINAANALSYTPNKLAGALKNRSSNLVAVVLPSMSNEVFPEVFDGIENVLGEHGLNAVLGLSNYDFDRELRVIRDLLAWSPMGIILTGLHHDATIGGMIAQLDIPVVQIMDIEGEPLGSAVGMSHTRAAESAADFLYAKGYRMFGYIGAWSERPNRSRTRRLAFEARIVKLGAQMIDSLILESRSSALAGAKATAQLRVQHPEIDCIFFANDDLALGGLFYAMSDGIDVPRDLGLMGFNGIRTGKATPLPLSSIQTPRYEMGVMAARRILQTDMHEDDIFDLGFEIIEGKTT